MFRKSLISLLPAFFISSSAFAQSGGLHVVSDLQQILTAPVPPLQEKCSVNDSGALIFSDGAGSTTGFYNGQSFPFPGNQRPLKLDNLFRMVGYTSDVTEHAAFWGAGGMSLLPTGADPTSRAFDINSQGNIVGDSSFPVSGSPSAVPHATAWVAGLNQAIDIHSAVYGASAVNDFSFAAAINDSNHVVTGRLDFTFGYTDVRLFDPSSGISRSLIISSPISGALSQVTDIQMNNSDTVIANVRISAGGSYVADKAYAWPQSQGLGAIQGGALFDPGFSSFVHVSGISDTNDAYGHTVLSTGPVALKWHIASGGIVQPVDLNGIAMLPANTHLAKALCVSRNGQYVGVLAGVGNTEHLMLLSY